MDALRTDIVNEAFLKKVLKEKYGEGAVLESFESRLGSEKGDNFVGDLIAVDLQVSLPEKKELHWMIKTLKPGPEGETMGFSQILRIFDREECFYTKFMDDLEKYVKKDVLKTVPFLYSTNENRKEALVFEHLKAMGYRDPINKKQGFDEDHIHLALDWLARLHGASHVLFTKYPGGHPSWAKEHFFSEPIKFSTFKDMADMMSENILSVFKSIQNGSKNDEFVQRFEAQYKKAFGKKNLFEKIEEDIYPPRSTKFHVLCHGDTWFNNMMFKYNEEGKVMDTIFLDMQLIYSGNVGSDLAYFLCTCVAYESLSKHLDEFLSYYHDRLQFHVADLDPSMKESPFTLQDIKLDFLKSSIIGFYIAFNVFPMILTKKENVIDIEFNKIDMSNTEEMAKMSKEFTDHNQQVIFKDELVYERMIGVIKFLLEINAFDYLK